MEPHLLAILFVSVPFGAALSVLRGVAFGDLRTGRIVLSANVEMGVRLVGALRAWGLGLGIEGVVFAVSLSIVAGWVVLADLLPAAPTATGYVSGGKSRCQTLLTVSTKAAPCSVVSRIRSFDAQNARA
jgi:hypothetical protein